MAHNRRSDSVMMLELAEGVTLSDRFNSLPELEFILVPHPGNAQDPIFVREDVLNRLSTKNFNKILNYVQGWNSRSKLRRIAQRRKQPQTFRDEYGDYTGGSSGDGSGITTEDVGAIVDLVDTVIGWFDSGSGSGSGSGSPQQVGTYIGVNGMVYCVRNIGGNTVGFGLDPSGKRLIAFSSPSEVLRIFQDLPPNMGGTLPFIQLPSAVNQGLVNYALSHPNKIVRIKPGTTNQFEVYDSIITQNPDGSINVLNPDGSGGEGIDNESSPGLMGLLPLALIGGLAYFSTK